MSQRINAKDVSIGELLGRYERRNITLPEFQRAFSWEKTHVAVFWTDIMSFQTLYTQSPVDASYFLGPIVILDGSTEITLLDGQQRLATATILLAALRDVGRTLDAENEHAGSDFARDIQRDLIENESGAKKYSLYLSEIDEPFFEKNIKSDPPSPTKARLRSHELILAAYSYFKQELERLIVTLTSSDSLIALKQLRNVLDKGVTLVAVTVRSEEDAYSIFETLNDRGLRLSVPDLLLNLLMRRSSDEQRPTVRAKWNYVLEHLGRRDVSRFVRHMWLSKYGDVKARGLYPEIKSHLESNNVNSLDFSETCADECDNYVEILEISKNLPEDSNVSVEGLIRHLDIPSSIPLLLSARRCLTETDFIKCAKLAVAIVVRYYVIANLNPLNLESAFYEAARVIRDRHANKETSGKSFAAAKSILMRLNPSDAVVEEAVKDLRLSRGAALWMISRIANAMQSKTKEIAMDESNLEHIFPQNATTDEWPNADDMQHLIWHIGNLTILGKRINAKARNKGFSDKCTQHYEASEIQMTRDLLKYTEWNNASVLDRASKLTKTILLTWRIV